jgi:UPF0755 protein
VSGGPPPVPGGRTPEEREAARRDRAARRAANDGAGAPAPPPAPRRVRSAGPDPAPPRPPRPPRRRWAGRLIAALAGGLLFAAIAWFLISLFQPFKGKGEGQVLVVIPKGAGVGEIGDLLEDRGVIDSSFFFELRARLSGRTGDLKPGNYRLSTDMSYGTALDRLERGLPPNVVRLVIPEGRSRSEVADIVGGQLDGSYLRQTRSSTAFDLRRYDAKGAASLEGFLFPATYELKRGKPVTALVEQQLAAFEREFAGVSLRYAKRKNLTPYDVLIIASMVEREAMLPRERRLIASVIYNRLREGIPLGIDATIRFATNNWTRPLRESELALDSPYNTRLSSGLPPGPIGSPGIDAIEAAANPARTRFLFYVVKPGTCGEHAFSSTDAQFQRDVAAYERERAERGGKSPTDC